MGEDLGEACSAINGKAEYEFHYKLDVDNTHRVLVHLRMKHGIRAKLVTIFMKEFGTDNGSELFKAFCDGIGVPTQISTI